MQQNFAAATFLNATRVSVARWLEKAALNWPSFPKALDAQFVRNPEPFAEVDKDNILAIIKHVDSGARVPRLSLAGAPHTI